VGGGEIAHSQRPSLECYGAYAERQSTEKAWKLQLCCCPKTTDPPSATYNVYRATAEEGPYTELTHHAPMTASMMTTPQSQGQLIGIP
jgi:hypothetical protein